MGGVAFSREDDGSISARDIEIGVASFDETKWKPQKLRLAFSTHEVGIPITKYSVFYV